MEELQPQDIEDLLQELEGEGGAQESPPPDVDALLRDVQADSFDRRLAAVRRLAMLEESSLDIVKALVVARDSDSTYTIKKEAEEALRAPVHQTCLQGYPDLMEATETALQQTPGSERVSLPAHFRVAVQGSTLHRVLSAGLTLLLLLLFGYSLFAGMFSGDAMCALVPALLMSGYWLLVAFANSTRITASREELIVERGPFPFPSRRFYSGKTRLDPAAFREIWAAPVEEKRDSGTGSGGRSDIGIAIVEVFLGVLLEQFMEPRLTYTLYARGKDGTDKVLLTRLKRGEAAYLRHTLQDLLDAGEQLSIVEELEPQKLEELVQQLEGEYGPQESLPQEVEELLHLLQSGTDYLAREAAAERLGSVGTSSPRIVEALIAAYESDSCRSVNMAAAEALRAPVHQEYMQEHPDLMAATERALRQAPGKGETGRVAHQEQSRSLIRCLIWSSGAGLAAGLLIGLWQAEESLFGNGGLACGAGFLVAAAVGAVVGAIVGAVAGGAVQERQDRIVGIVLGAMLAAVVASVSWGAVLLVQFAEWIGA